MNRKEQKEKRRKEILAVGLDLFVRKGYAATKTQDISRAVGMSEGLLFHYFESKEKLYEELINIGISGPRSVLSGIDGDPLEFFQTAAREILRYIKTEPFVKVRNVDLTGELRVLSALVSLDERDNLT